jgi:hypothetical protein
MDKFSSRHGFESPDAEIKVRHESPSELRGIVVILLLMKQVSAQESTGAEQQVVVVRL